MTNVNKTVDVAALDLLCDKLECGDANHRATAAQIRKAMNGAKPQLPEGIEWPRFEDGELVKFGDEFIAPEYGENEPQKLTRLALYTEEHFHNGAKGAFWEANYFIPGGAIGKDYRLKRPEPEVLDADGVPIKVGDTVYAPGYFEAALKVERFDAAMKMVVVFSEETLSCGFRGDQLTHRKPDTQEAIDADAAKDPCTYYGWTGHMNCDGCPSGNGGADVNADDCQAAQKRDLLERQRKLMGGAR